ncbi:UDP-2,3-diacylglucosamine diphosphatase [Vibrio sp.]|nr:UDP-2,3-diacylglucosamine diphosphatase [Vibrio sp.]
MTTYFISDLHLSPSTHEITTHFINFLNNEAKHADALYILGDLFEFWIGDDDKSPFAVQIRTSLKELVNQGIPCYFTKGNRDFLVGEAFAKQTGMHLLGDETVIDLYGRKAIILHGDTLCTRDVDYLAFRAKVHQPWLQWCFNHLPYSIRKKIVAKVQAGAKEGKQYKAMDIMDVTEDEVTKVMNHYDVDLMIHGHTHRPNVHKMDNGKTRIVLGDWYHQSSVLSFSASGYKLTNNSFHAEEQ